MRLQKYLAKAGIASRRKSEALILEGRVKVNGVIVKEMGIIIDQSKDIVLFDDNKVALEKNQLVILLNKPKGYVSTVNDQFDRKTVIELIPDIKERLYPIGRLDYYSSGLLLLTNDGDLTYQLTHPKHHVSKVYRVKVDTTFRDEDIERFENGLEIDGYMTQKALLEVLERYPNQSILKITLNEGRNRQIRKMLEVLNYNVVDLERIMIGNLADPNLKPGQYRYLSETEINELKGE